MEPNNNNSAGTKKDQDQGNCLQEIPIHITLPPQQNLREAEASSVSKSFMDTWMEIPFIKWCQARPGLPRSNAHFVNVFSTNRKRRNVRVFVRDIRTAYVSLLHIVVLVWYARGLGAEWILNYIVRWLIHFKAKLDTTHFICIHLG